MEKNTKKSIFDAMSFLSCLREINSKESFRRAENLKEELIAKLRNIDNDIAEHFNIIVSQQMRIIKNILNTVYKTPV